MSAVTKPGALRDLDLLFDPRSVAVVGASADTDKWGYWTSRCVLRGAERREVYLVNRKGGEILGQTAYRSFAELPAAPDVAIVVVPSRGFEAAVDDALAHGVRGIVAITSGLGESGEAGRRTERAIAERVRAAGAVMVGPNCNGVLDTSAGFDGAPFTDMPAGPVGIVSQSGNLANDLAALLRERRLGVSRFAAVGNQADVTIAEIVHSLARHEPTRLMAIYAEEFRDARVLFGEIAAAVAGGTSVIVLSPGSSAAVTRAAQSHTGSLVSDRDTVAAACRRAGAHLVSGMTELADLAAALASPLRSRGRRVLVFGDGGGHATLAAGSIENAGLEVPRLSDELQRQLAALLPEGAGAPTNPVDLVGAMDQMTFARVADAALATPEVDAALLTGWIGGWSQSDSSTEAWAEREREALLATAAASERHGKPLAVATMFPDSPSVAAMRDAGIAAFRDAAAATRALRALADDLAPLPPPALPPAAPAAGEVLSYAGARALVAGAGIPLAEAAEVTTADEAVATAERIGYPVVVKGLGRLHKSEGGGVVVGVADAAELRRVVEDMAARLVPTSYSIERQLPTGDGLELIVGCRTDPRFGPVVAVGAGGIFVEILRDMRVALAPVSAAEAEELLRALRCAPLLDGARGRPPLDVAAAAEVVAALSDLAARRPDLAEVEVNPLLVLPDGAVALDARAIPAHEDPEHS